MRGIRLALTTLTIAPVHGPADPDRHDAGVAMGLAPLVGALLAVAAAAVLLAFRVVSPVGSPALLPCVAAISVLALLTRGLHLDGLADTVDGLASYRPAPQALAVMRRSDIGPNGVVALTLSLALQVAALLHATHDGRGTLSLLLAAVGGRIAVAAACTARTPAATRTGLGALVAGTVPRAVPLAWTALTAVAAAAYGALDGTGPPGPMAVNAVRPVLALAVGLLVARALRRHATRRLGGITGDVLGALVEVTTTVVLVVMSMDLPLPVQQWFDLHQTV